MSILESVFITFEKETKQSCFYEINFNTDSLFISLISLVIFLDGIISETPCARYREPSHSSEQLHNETAWRNGRAYRKSD